MPSHPRALRSPLASPVAVLLAVATLLAGLVLVATNDASALAASSAAVAAAQECPEGTELNPNGLSCDPVIETQQDPNNPCPAGQQLDAAGLLCEAIPEDPAQICPDGQQLDAAGLLCEPIPQSSGNCPDGQQPNDIGTACVPIDDSSGGEPACDAGFSLGADGVTCVADGPTCGRDEVIGDNGECIKSFQCKPGFVLASDLLSCLSDGCPADELLSVDGKRCLAPGSDCPDGSPRPVGGSCLVVETVEGEDGETEVIVRCDDDDAFCQAQVKECAEARAAGDDDGDESCEDPRASCDEGDDACEQANERLVECAVRDDEGAGAGEAELIRSGGDPCDDLCPPLHRLDDSGECIEYLDPRHPCVSFGQVPAGVTTNRELDGFSYLAGTGQCVTKAEFLRRLGNFEAAAGAEADALALLRETTAEYLTVEEQIEELEAARVVAEQQVVDYTEAAAVADAKRAQNEKDLHEARKRLQRELRLLEAEVLEVYVTGGSDEAISAALLGAEDISEIGIVQSYGRALLDDQIDNIERIRDLETETIELGTELERAAAEVQESLEAAVATSADIESLLTETEQLRAEQIERRDAEAEMVAVLREEKGQYAQELGIFDQASREIADIISESEFIVTELATGDGLFGKPVIPADVVSGFGPRLHPILGYVRNHNGLDFDGNFGDPIYASQSGIVQIASSFGGYGETVVLDHGAGLLTLYAHMSVIGAEVGDQVQRGDVIGFVGSTGLSTGPHLHFEVWVEGRTAVDPLLYLTDLD